MAHVTHKRDLSALPFLYMNVDSPDAPTLATCLRFGERKCSNGCPRHMPAAYAKYNAKHRR